MDRPIIEVKDHGPYELSGSFKLMDEDGNTFETDSSIALCRCGKSGEKPFCDGTHEEIDFHSAPRVKNLFVEV